jgi:hypothetical protein
MLDKIIPPLCGRVRFLVALITLTVAVPRLPMLDFLPSAPLGLLVPAVYAYTLLPLGLALVVTSYRWRVHWAGRLVAMLSFVSWVTLTFAALSVTSIAINAIMAGVLFTEILAHHDC